MFFHELARLVTAALFAAMLRLTLFLARQIKQNAKNAAWS